MHKKIYDGNNFRPAHFQRHHRKCAIGGDIRRTEKDIRWWGEFIQGLYDNKHELIQRFTAYLERTNYYTNTARKINAIKYKKIRE